MLNGIAVVHLNSDSRIRRIIVAGGSAPEADPESVLKVELILKKGSIRYTFDSDNNPEVVLMPNENWAIDLALGLQSIVPGEYQALLKIFDSQSDDGLVVDPFKIQFFDV